MTNIKEVLSKWIRVFSHREKIRINYFFKSLISELRSNYNESSMISDMKRDLGQEIIDTTPSALPSCLGMFLVICFLSITWYNNIRYKDRAYYASLLYIDLDYTIDNSEDPGEYIRFIGNFIEEDLKALRNGVELPPVPEGYRNLEWYRKMTGRNYKIINKVYELFNAEVQSAYTQKRSEDRGKLKNITVTKSAKTAEFLCAILDIEDEGMINDTVFVGYLSQLIDDMYDIEEDMKLGINTLPSYEIKHRGNIDVIIIETIQGIGILDNKYNTLRYILLLMTLYIASRYCRYISPELMVILDHYIILDHRYSLDLDLWI